MTDVPDFITQVRNPNDPEDKPLPEPTTKSEPEKPSPAPKKKCWFFCCGGSEIEDTSASQNHDKKRTATVGRISINPGTSPITQVDPNNNDKYGINSPRMSGKYQVQGQAAHSDDHLLPPQNEKKKGKKCLVLDLDETLVHSSFKQVPCDFVVPVKIEEKTYKVYVAKRPHVDEFMRRCGELYEIVIFTASLAQYADPVVDLLDIHKVVDWRLFRESCTPFKGAYVKDMGRMGRDISQIMIVDNSPHSYLFNKENAFPCETWYNDQNDQELMDFIPILEKLSETSVADVRITLREMGISPLEMEEDVLATSQEDTEGSEYSGSETGSMESEYTGSSEYSQTEGEQQQTKT